MKKLIIIPSFLISSKAFTQRPHTGMWLNAAIPVSITKKWQWHNDVSYRTLGSSVTPLQYEYRTGIRYHFNSSWSATAGSAFFFTRNSFSKQLNEFGKEFRLWQELAYRNNFSKLFQLYIRLRTEERSFAATSNKASYHAFRYRIRTQLQQQLNKKWALQLVDEYFQQHRSSWLFDQNRGIANIVYAANKQTTLAGGYMWLRWPGGVSQHILNISYQQTISLHGKP